MKRISVLFVIVAALTATGVRAQDGARLFREAMNKETVDGDCKGAIELYRKVASGSDRALAAQSLLRMGECQRKLGDAEAKKTFERIVAQYSDQKDTVTQARAQLGPRPLSLSNRPVWTVPDNAAYFFGRVSKDGRLLPYRSLKDGEIYLHDFSTNTDRKITNAATGSSANDERGGFYRSSFSPDGTQLAFPWARGNREQLRLVNLSGTGVPTARVLMNDPNLQWVQAYDWSPDGKSIVVGVWMAGSNADDVSILSVSDGTMRRLWPQPGGGGESLGNGSVVYSPDGKYLAINPVVEGAPVDAERRIIVIDVATGRTSPAVTGGNDFLLAWHSSGLVIASNRNGTESLWHVPMNGSTAGAPQALDIAPPCVTCRDPRRPQAFVDTLGMSASGTFFYRVTPGEFMDLRVAAVNPSTGQLNSVPVTVAQQLTGIFSRATISRDGRHMAFLSDPDRNGYTLSIYTLDTRQLKAVRTNIMGFGSGSLDLAWSPDGTSLAGRMRLADGRRGIGRVNPATGEVTMITTWSAGVDSFYEVFRQWSLDGRKIYFDRDVPNRQSAVIERDLASGNERELHRGVAAGDVGLALSADASTLYYRHPVGEVGSLMARTIATGEEREIAGGQRFGAVRLSPDGRLISTVSRTTSTNLLVATDGSGTREYGKGFSVVAWAPDSKSVLTTKRADATGNTDLTELWQVPIDGSQPRRVELPTGGGPLSAITVGGRWLTYRVTTSPAGPAQVFALENFLPARPGGFK